jgi:hypothetical protein
MMTDPFSFDPFSFDPFSFDPFLAFANSQIPRAEPNFVEPTREPFFRDLKLVSVL